MIFSAVRVCKFDILQGGARLVAIAAGAGPGDLVIVATMLVKAYEGHRPFYVVEKIVGDPLVYLMRKP